MKSLDQILRIHHEVITLEFIAKALHTRAHEWMLESEGEEAEMFRRLKEDLEELLEYES